MSPGYDQEYSQEPQLISPKETSVNGTDQTQPSRSSTNSPDGSSTIKTATLRNKLEAELKFDGRGKSLSHSPSPAPASVRCRTASSNQASSDISKNEVSQLSSRPANIPAPPPFTPAKSKVAKEDKKSPKDSLVKVTLYHAI